MRGEVVEGVSVVMVEVVFFGYRWLLLSQLSLSEKLQTIPCLSWFVLVIVLGETGLWSTRSVESIFVPFLPVENVLEQVITAVGSYVDRSIPRMSFSSFLPLNPFWALPVSG